jgi:AcrR family transcriptional regulator
MVAAQFAISAARERILEAAERVVSDVGAARLTLDAVAQAAAISKGGLLYHFPSKEALVTALAERYVRHLRSCIDDTRSTLPADDRAAGLKASVLGVLGGDPRCKTLGTALLAAAANATDLTLLEVIRQHIEQQSHELGASATDFARAAVVALAIDGLKMRESLRISAFSGEQRTAIVQELLRLADEAYK